MLIRFSDVLRSRIVELNETFKTAIAEYGYKGEFKGVYPIKVNQHRYVVEEIVVLIDVRRITDVCDLPLLVDVDTGFGGAFNIARTVKSLIKFGAGAMHIEDQVQAKRCGHRPNKEIVSREEMVDRIKAAVDARTDPDFVIMARTDALAVEGLDAAIERACACVEAGADMIFPEAITELAMYRKFADAVKVPVLANITEFGATPLFTVDELRIGQRRAWRCIRSPPFAR